MRPMIAILTVVSAVTLAGMAVAQQTDSHLAIPDWGGASGGLHNTSELAKQLKGRLGQRPMPPASNIDPELIETIRDMMLKKPQSEWKDIFKKHPELADVVKRSINDPRVRDELLGDRLGQDERVRGGHLANMQEQLKQMQSPASGATGGPMVATTGPGRQATRPQNPNPTSSPNDGSGPSKVRAPSGNVPPRTASSGRTGDATNSEFAKSMERWFGKSFGDSAAMKRFASDMGKKDWDKILDSAVNRAGKGPKVNWNKFGNRMQDTGRFLDRHSPNISARDLPRAPNINVPNLPRGPHLPSMSAPSGGGGAVSGSFTALLVIAGLAVGGYLFWRLVIRPMQLAKRGANAENRIGPWPVNPTQIKTREELVLAFDYLALRSCGKPARMWHYREVANRLGSDDPQRRRVAANLAQSYAAARYAPPSELLEESTAQQAGHDICALAGEAAP